VTARRVLWLAATVSLAVVMNGACSKDAPARGSAVQTPDLPWEVSFHGAMERASKLGRPVMVDFYTDWCGWCKVLDRTTLADSRVRRALERFVLVKLNAEKEGNEAADRFEVRQYPTLVFLDAKGQEIGRIAGYLESEDFLKEVEGILNRT